MVGTVVTLIACDPSVAAANHGWIVRLAASITAAPGVVLVNNLDVWPDLVVVLGSEGAWTAGLARHAAALADSAVCVWIGRRTDPNGQPPRQLAFHVAALLDADAVEGPHTGSVLPIPGWYPALDALVHNGGGKVTWTGVEGASLGATALAKLAPHRDSPAQLTAATVALMAEADGPFRAAVATKWQTMAALKSVRGALARARLIRLLGEPERALDHLNFSGLLNNLQSTPTDDRSPSTAVHDDKSPSSVDDKLASTGGKSGTRGEDDGGAIVTLAKTAAGLAVLGEAVDCLLEADSADREKGGGTRGEWLSRAGDIVDRLVRARLPTVVADAAWLTRFAAAFAYDYPRPRIDALGAPLVSPPHVPMKIVNLDRRPDRWRNFQRQLDQYNNLARFPLDAQRWPAVDGLVWKRQGPQSVPPIFRVPKEGVLQNGERRKQLPFGAIGCFQSHVAILRALAADAPKPGKSDWWLFGEDDAVLGPMFVRDWAMLEQLLPDLTEAVDIIWCGFLQTPQTRWAAVMNCAPRRFVLSSQNEAQRLIGGTHGFLVSRRGARKLLDLYDKATEPITIGIDSWLYRAPVTQLTLDPPTILAQYYIASDPNSLDSDCAV